MKDTSTSPEEIARLRSDLDTIQSAIGGGLPFDKMDIRFGVAIAVALVLFGLLEQFGYNAGAGIRLLAFSPVLLALAAYFVCMAIRARRRSKSSPTIRKENRLAVIVVVMLAVSIPLLKSWAIGQGLDARTFDAINMVTIGIATFAMSFLPFTTAPAFRRLSIGGSGVAIIITGLLLPSLTSETRMLGFSTCLFVVIVYQVLLMQYFLNRESTSESASTPDGK